jgi:hypothetical protein
MQGRCQSELERTAARAPMMMEAHGATQAQQAVMETRPARMPLQTATMSYHPVRYLIQKTETTPAVPAASVVQTAERVASSALSGVEMPPAEPGLKPYLPHTRADQAASGAATRLPRAEMPANPVPTNPVAQSGDGTHQPTQSRKVPMQMSGAEWPRKRLALRFPSASKRPFRGPSTAAPMRPERPPT